LGDRKKFSTCGHPRTSLAPGIQDPLHATEVRPKLESGCPRSDALSIFHRFRPPRLLFYTIEAVQLLLTLRAAEEIILEAAVSPVNSSGVSRFWGSNIGGLFVWRRKEDFSGELHHSYVVPYLSQISVLQCCQFFHEYYPQEMYVININIIQHKQVFKLVKRCQAPMRYCIL